MFDTVARGPVDPMFELKDRADRDRSLQKVDLGVGIYRNEAGEYHELRCVNRAKKTLATLNPGHDYDLTTGNARFLDHAIHLLLNEQCEALRSNKIASVQTISGTGANHLGALLISKVSVAPAPQVYIGMPAWGNYEPLFRLVGLDVVQYNYYDTRKRQVDFDSCIKAVRKAPKGSVFVLQGCCHNPTGADFNQEQWQRLGYEMQLAQHLPFFDIAYQGLGDGVDEDAFGIRTFIDMGFEMVVCQSFSKNLGLYGERTGALHVINKSQEIALNVRDQLRSLIRWEFSSSPAFGARLANIVLESAEATKDWLQELGEMRERLHKNRSCLFRLLSRNFETPGDWNHILEEKGLFCYLKLSPTQCQVLTNEHHIYLPTNGRINIAGLNESCIERVASAIDDVVRQELSQL